MRRLDDPALETSAQLAGMVLPLERAAMRLAPAWRNGGESGGGRSFEQRKAELSLRRGQSRSAGGYNRPRPDTFMPLAPGLRLGPYEVVSALGAGGMGEVYRARDRKLGRDVALKILPEPFATDPGRLARFAREARALAALNHPHIAQIYGFEEWNGIHAFAMELVEGDTLTDRLARGAIPVDDALDIAAQIADALDTAHQSDIIHRDLKPANIQIRPDGVVKVLDFGLAKAAHAAGKDDLVNVSTMTNAVTRPGVVMGTAPYMSPEQARGQAVDKRTDVWAFGCIVYEMLTGRAAFAGETVSDTLARVLEREPAWEELGEIPAALDRLLKRSLSKDPKRRLHDMADARLELEDAIADLRAGGLLRGTTRNQPGRLLRPLAFAGWLVAAAALVMLGFRLPPRAISEPLASRDLIATRLTHQGGTESATALAPDGRSFVFVSTHEGTPDLWVRQVSGGEPVRLTQDESSEADPVFAPDGESVFFTRFDVGEPSIWRTQPLGGTPRRVFGNARGPGPSPDGRSLAYWRPAEGGGFSLLMSALDGSSTRMLLQSAPTPVPPRWSPDGRTIAYIRGGFFAAQNLFVLDVASGGERQVTQFTRSEEGITSVAWFPDNQHAAVTFIPAQAASQHDIGIVDVEDGAVSRVTYSIDVAYGGISLSADGARLVVAANRHDHSVWKVPLGSDPVENGRRAEQLLENRFNPAFSLVSRDGRLILFTGGGTGSRNVWMVPTDLSASPRQITIVPGNAIQHGSLSPDARRVAFSSRAGGHHDIWTQHVDGSDLRQITNDSAPDSWPVWSPDGRTIVYNTLREGRSETWRVPSTGGTPEKLDDGFFRGDWIQQPSGTGSWLVSWKGGTVRLLDPEQRAVVWDVPAADAAGALPMFSPDGQYISVPVRESRYQQAIRILDARTGEHVRLAARLPPQFSIEFRANWAENGKAFIVTRAQNVSHVVLFDGLSVRGAGE